MLIISKIQLVTVILHAHYLQSDPKHAPAGTTGDQGKTGKGAGGRGGGKTLTGLSVPWLLLSAPWLLLILGVQATNNDKVRVTAPPVIPSLSSL